MFYDQTAVQLAAGNGGTGAMSFRREKFLPKGGPDGGDGGKGGDVVLECDENVGDLRQFHFKPQYAARTGGSGEGRQKTGRSGEAVTLKLPPGTEILDANTGDIVAELLTHGQTLILLRGGKGGRGNYSYRSSTNRAPRQFTTGDPGETGDFIFVLKSIADVGLLGFPNAGKSTLIGLLTEARPKTGAYPFTTIHPSVGVMLDPTTFERIKVADIPGLIEGASENRGLGHRFLRHIERCKILLFLIDMAGTDGRNPWDDYKQLAHEIEAYDPTLVDRPRLVVANKMDMPEAAELLKTFKKKVKTPLLAISCADESGLEDLRKTLFSRVRELPSPMKAPEPALPNDE
jgi:GTP-binding protein